MSLYKKWKRNMRIRCSYCGAEHTVPTFYIKLYSIFRKEYSFICQYCLHYNNRLLMFRTVHDISKKEKIYNKKIEEQKYDNS